MMKYSIQTYVVQWGGRENVSPSDHCPMNIWWNLYRGDTIIFNYVGHNFQKFKDREYYETCDFSNSVDLTYNHPQGTKITFTKEGVYYYGCAAQCIAKDQKIKITVLPLPRNY